MLENFILHVHVYLYFTKFATSKRNRRKDIRAMFLDCIFLLSEDEN